MKKDYAKQWVNGSILMHGSYLIWILYLITNPPLLFKLILFFFLIVGFIVEINQYYNIIKRLVVADSFKKLMAARDLALELKNKNSDRG